MNTGYLTTKNKIKLLIEAKDCLFGFRLFRFSGIVVYYVLKFCQTFFDFGFGETVYRNRPGKYNAWRQNSKQVLRFYLVFEFWLSCINCNISVVDKNYNVTIVCNDPV